MAIETLKESVCIDQIIGKAKENIVAESDIIIPDIKPDILSTINTNGTVCIYKKEISNGKIRIDGGVHVYIMYLADDEHSNVRGINAVVDFTKVIDMENITSSMNMESNINLKNIECKILNGRKISIKAEIDVEISVYSNENVEFIKTIQDRNDIQVLNSNTTIDSLLGTGITKVYAKDTINIPNTDRIAEVMKISLNLTNKESKTSYNKVLAKAEMQINMVYLTEDNNVNEVKWQIPVMGFIDMQNVSDENICNIKYEIKNVLIKPNNVEEHSIYVEVELEISCNIYEKKELNIIQDLYSPNETLNVSQKNITVMKDKQSITNSVSVNERLVIPDLHNNRIVNTEVTPVIVKQNIYNDRVILDGELQVNFMYISSVTNRIEIKTQNIPFSVNMEGAGITQTSNLNTNVEVISKEFTTMPDDSIEANVELSVIVDVSRMTEISVIDNIESAEDSDENVYSIVVYFVKPGDTLWNIAKRFKSTISAIASVNGIEDENVINVGQQLFIPKFVGA
ncbi:MAG: DUF3794 domain-containing protein [Clostridia bacterium]|nr:DUF3794 domain-containing protein [Clostridia bacterium]